MTRLDCHKAAEAAPEHEDRREPQDAAERIERDAEPPDAFAAEGQNIVLVRVGGQIGVGEAEHAKRPNHPTVRAVFAHAGPNVAFGEQRGDAKRDRDRRQRDQREMRKEPACAAGPRDGEAEIDGEANDCEQREPRGGQSVLRTSSRSVILPWPVGMALAIHRGRTIVGALPARRRAERDVGHAFRHRNRACGEAEADHGNRRQDRRPGIGALRLRALDRQDRCRFPREPRGPAGRQADPRHRDQPDAGGRRQDDDDRRARRRAEPHRQEGDRSACASLRSGPASA